MWSSRDVVTFGLQGLSLTIKPRDEEKSRADERRFAKIAVLCAKQRAQGAVSIAGVPSSARRFGV
jgi:hypothetical protein